MKNFTINDYYSFLKECELGNQPMFDDVNITISDKYEGDMVNDYIDYDCNTKIVLLKGADRIKALDILGIYTNAVIFLVEVTHIWRDYSSIKVEDVDQEHFLVIGDVSNERIRVEW